MTLQDRIELLTTARDLLDETISLIDGQIAQLSNFAVCTKSEALNLDRTYELMDEMRARRDGIQSKISTLNDQIENEAEPDEQPEPDIKTVTIGGNTETGASYTVKLEEGKHYDTSRILAAIHFPEPPLNGGQVINRIIQAHTDAPKMPVYIYDYNADHEETYEPVQFVEAHNGKVIIY